MKVLSIGNSFSMDAQRYLHQLARREGVDLFCMNLYIGGCAQRTHYLNILDEIKQLKNMFVPISPEEMNPDFGTLVEENMVFDPE